MVAQKDPGENLQGALDLAKADYSVFAVDDKHPIVDGSFYGSHKDPDEIKKMFHQGHRKCGVAIATGSGFSDVVVIDADSPDALEWMRERFGEPHVKTKRGGHFYFRHPKNGKVKSVNKFAQGLDCKGDGGYVVAPPSPGKEWTNGIPDKRSLRVLPDEVRPPERTSSSNRTGGDLPKDVFDKAVEAIAKHYPRKGEESQYDFGMCLAGFLLYRRVTEEDAFNLMLAAKEMQPEGVDKAERNIRRVVETTAQRIANDEPYTARPTLEKRAPGLADELWRILKLRRKDGESDNTSGFDSSDYKKEGSDETNWKPLPLKTGSEIALSTPEQTEWIAYPWFAKGTITEVSGAIKRAGKTTFLAHCVSKILRGKKFLDGETQKTSVVYLTEQAPNSFRRVITAAKLERDDFHVLYWQEVRDYEWEDLIEAVVAEAEKREAELIVIDVISRWASFLGVDESSPEYANRVMPALKAAVAKGFTIVYARHDRKGGGPVGESGRGTSQVGGDADQLIQLRRGDGNTRHTVRAIEAVGRFGDDTPDLLMIELKDGEYVSLGDAKAFASAQAEKDVWDALPTSKEEALSGEEVVKAAEGQSKRSAITEALKRMREEKLIQHTGTGKRGDAYRYYKDPNSDSSERPSSRSDETKSGPRAPGFDSSDPPPYRSDETNPTSKPRGSKDLPWKTVEEFREAYPPPDRSEALEPEQLSWEVLLQEEPRRADLEAKVLKICEETKDRLNFCEEIAFRGGHNGDSVYGRMQKLVGWNAENPKLRSSAAYDIAYDRLYDLFPYCRRCAHHTGPLHPAHPDALEEPTWADLCNTDDRFEELMMDARQLADHFVAAFIPSWRHQCAGDEERFIWTLHDKFWDVRGQTAVEIEKICVDNPTLSSDDAHMVGMTAIYGYFRQRVMEAVC